MIANPEKFQVILLRKNQTNASRETVNIKGELLKSKKTVQLLGIYLDCKLNFEQHISEICRKAASQLNALKRLKRFIAFNEKKILVQSFIFSNFDYCPLLWHFSSTNSLQKLRKSLNVLLDSYTKTSSVHKVIYFGNQERVPCMFPD